MATKAERGTKRTCQNSDCGARFYDLHRTPIICPICESEYVIASAPASIEPVAEAPKPNKEFADTEALSANEDTEVEAEALADLETDDESVAAEGDETFLEEEEDGGDVSGIIGSGVAEDEEGG
ncbi:MAG: FYDLN acid domain-containing protein [Hyphomicrobiaceae bacterium]